MAATGSPRVTHELPSGALGDAAARRRVFSVGHVDYVWADVVVFAHQGGAWARLEQEVREGLACMRHAEETGTTLSPAEVAASARAFRYERRLITAEETEAWLAERRIDVAQWMGFIRRTLLRKLHAANLAALTAAFPATDEEVAGLTWPTGVCGGCLGALALELAGRAAVHARIMESDPGTTQGLDDTFALFRAEMLTPATLRETVSSRHLDWLRVVREEIRFVREGAAAEALLGLRQDGLDMAEVAQLADAELQRHDSYLEDVEPELRPLLLGAREGEVLGPLLRDDGCSVVKVVAKILPSLDQLDVRRRAERDVISLAVRREVEERVRWHERF